ncbi:hypothetical protein UY3_16786 [Chelonia mydas]|uniref:Uncharacterized protein n=1 Tax=Chelonia mydas TaxID=8469 RepID=M7BD47_CHEMY|nr:hypothetical protein UY3_16786 [Chelonia mydas]
MTQNQDAYHCPAAPERDVPEGTTSSTWDPEATYHSSPWSGLPPGSTHSTAQDLDIAHCPTSESSPPPGVISLPQASLVDQEVPPSESAGTTEVPGEDDCISLQYPIPTGSHLFPFCFPFRGIQTLGARSKHVRKAHNKWIAFQCTCCVPPFETQKKRSNSDPPRRSGFSIPRAIEHKGGPTASRGKHDLRLEDQPTSRQHQKNQPCLQNPHAGPCRGGNDCHLASQQPHQTPQRPHRNHLAQYECKMKQRSPTEDEHPHVWKQSYICQNPFYIPMRQFVLSDMNSSDITDI